MQQALAGGAIEFGYDHKKELIDELSTFTVHGLLGKRV